MSGRRALSETIGEVLSEYRKGAIEVSEVSESYRTLIGKALSNYRTGAQVWRRGSTNTPEDWRGSRTYISYSLDAVTTVVGR